MRVKTVVLAIVLALSATTAASGADPAPPEPPGIWTGPLQGAVPVTITGGEVLGTEELAALVAAEGPVLVDVAPWPRKPENLASGTWSRPPHRSLPGAVWLPDVGNGDIPLAHEAWLRARLKALTGNDPGKPLVIFCHPNCWASWNAAKRAILYGYQRVYWYPDGVEGWQDSGRPTEVIQAQKRPG